MTPTTAITIPEVEEGAATCWISALNVKEGQAVQPGQILLRLEGKNQYREILSPEEGFIVGLHAIPGQTVHPGDVLCYICSRPSIKSAQPGPQALFPGLAVHDSNALLVFGGGGHGKTVIDLLRTLGTYRVVGVIDDGLPPGSEVLGVPVVGGAGDLAEWYSRGIRLAVNAVGGIGNVAVRLKVFELLSQGGFSCPTIIHPTAVVEHSASVDAGVQIFAHAYVGSAARIGFGTVLNTSAIAHHDCILGRVVNLSPGATLAGNVHVEDHAQIGMRATVNLKVTVGQAALLGNGCTVKADVPAGTRVRAGTIWPVPLSVDRKKK